MNNTKIRSREELVNCIFNEPCLETLKSMPNNFIDCVITSPPYWQLRDYGYDGQWGLEPSFTKYLENLWTMMDEVYRVLKPSGTCWINLGDTYARGSRGKDGTNHSLVSKSNEIIEPRTSPDYNGLDKCLLLIPHRFAIGCIERGWIIRNDIIWAKRNGMPESTKDRFSKKHEYFFFMVKNTKYFFNLDAIRDKHKSIDDLERRQQNGVSEWKTQMASDTYAINGTGRDRSELYNKNGKNPGDVSDFWDINTKPSSNNHYTGYNSKYDTTEIESAHRQGMNKERGQNIVIKRNNLPTQKVFVDFIRARTTINLVVESTDLIKSKVEHWFRYDEAGFSFPSIEDWNIMKHLFNNFDDEFHNIDVMLNNFEIETDDILKNIKNGKNPGDVSDFWDINTKPSSNNHYAGYNEELIRKPILAGCPEFVCKKCGIPRTNISKPILSTECDRPLVVYDKTTPYSVGQRSGLIEARELPPLKDLKEYLKKWKGSITIEQIESLMESQAPHHWFSGESYPSVEDWIKLKSIINFDSTYDILMTTIKYKPSEKGATEYVSELSDCGCNAGFEGGIIYDPFMGTGSTAESTIRANRNFIGSEMSKDYCEIANKRLEPFLLQTKLF